MARRRRDNLASINKSLAAMSADLTAVLSVLGIPRPPDLHPPHAGIRSLTIREREVAELIGHGLTNREIARKLAIAQRTAESHVEGILRKLGFARRRQVIAWLAARGGQLPPYRPQPRPKVTRRRSPSTPQEHPPL